MYDLVSGSQILKSSYFLNKTRSMEAFPHLKENELKGALVYNDDIAFTACRYGAAIANYVEVVELLKGPSENPSHTDACGNRKLVVNGARMRDLLTGKEFTVRARCVVNATGPFTDDVRKMEDKGLEPICQPSSGTHIILPNYYSPEHMGLLDPSTTDGRVIFFLPWLGHVIAGTTDHSCEVTTSPEPTDDDIQFILSEIKSYLSSDLKEYGLDRDVALHLTSTYGGHAVEIAQRAKLTGRRYPLVGRRLHPDFPVIEAEIPWACGEYACNAIDFLARRCRVAFLDVRVAGEILPKVIDLMGAEYNWSASRKKKEFNDTMHFLRTEMGLDMKRKRDIEVNFPVEELKVG
ncbi:hypothetical protein Aperf_G00000072291 [Anoplocephala perfoliata]